MMATARDRVRRASLTLGWSNEAQHKSHQQNNNQGQPPQGSFVNYGISVEDDPTMSDREKSLRLRMAKRDAMMR